MLKLTSCMQAGLLLAAGFLTTGMVTAQERSRTMTVKPEMKELLQRMEKHADEFEDKFDAALDRSDVNGTTLERRLNSLADTVEDAVDDMAKHFDDGETKEFINKLENAMIAASGVNRFMLRNDMSSAAEQWDMLRKGLNEVANEYHRPVLANITVATLVPVTAQMLSKPDVKLSMERIEAAADRFHKKFDDAIQHSTANLTDREDLFKTWGKDLEDATDEMMEQFKDKDYKDFAHRLEETLVVADVINRMMIRSELFKDAELQWKELREDLNKAAVVFGHPVLPNMVVSVRARAQ